jgi:hypothetical protein
MQARTKMNFYSSFLGSSVGFLFFDTALVTTCAWKTIFSVQDVAGILKPTSSCDKARRILLHSVLIIAGTVQYCTVKNQFFWSRDDRLGSRGRAVGVGLSWLMLTVPLTNGLLCEEKLAWEPPQRSKSFLETMMGLR